METTASFKAHLAVWAVLALQTHMNAQTTGVITDPRDGKIYKTITISGKTWLAQNLNYEATESWCYEDDPKFCADYGRLYTDLLLRCGGQFLHSLLICST